MEDSTRARWSNPEDGPVPAAEPPPPAAAPNDAATPSRRRAPEAAGRRAKKPRVAASRVKDAAADAGGAGGAGGSGSGGWVCLKCTFMAIVWRKMMETSDQQVDGRAAVPEFVKQSWMMDM